MSKDGGHNNKEVFQVSKQYLKWFRNNVRWYEKLNLKCDADANADADVTRIALPILRIVELKTSSGISSETTLKVQCGT